MRRAALFTTLTLLASGAGAQMSIQEYPLPRGNSAHDVWADPAPDGPVWFSGQGSGNAGRLDPKTGKVELIPLGPGASRSYRLYLARDFKGYQRDRP